MSLLTSPNDHIPAKPAPSIETNKTIEESDSDIDEVEGLNSDSVAVLLEIIEECGADESYRLKFIEMDRTYDHNIKTPLRFTYSDEPESICNVNEYNR